MIQRARPTDLLPQTTIGIPILILWLRLFTYGFSKTPFGQPTESIKSGNYGHPPRYVWWLKQCLIYFLGLLFMKACVFVIFKACPWIVHVGDWALRWTEGNEQVQVFFVMLFFPLIMNALQYYIIDGFIKSKKPVDHEAVAGEDEDDGGDRDGLVPPNSGNVWDASFDSEDEEDDLKKKRASGDERTRLVKPTPAVKVEGPEREEYDEAADGEDTSPASGSSSRLPNDGKARQR